MLKEGEEENTWPNVETSKILRPAPIPKLMKLIDFCSWIFIGGFAGCCVGPCKLLYIQRNYGNEKLIKGYTR